MKYYEFPCGCKVKQLSDEIKPEDGLPQLEIDYLNINHGCPLIWQLFSDGYTKGIFQLETNLGQHWSKKVKPMNGLEISALIAAIRPGTLKSKEENKSMTEHYVDRKHGVEPTVYFHSDAEKILKESYGIILYQEQTLAIAKHFAGFDLVQADNLRRAMGKKDPELMNKCKIEFTEGCKQTGILTEEVAKQVFDIIEKSNRYSFNKCVSGDTILRSKVGDTPTVKTLFQEGKRPKILSMTAEGKIVSNKVANITSEGVQKVFTVILENEEEITVTENHKFPSPAGEKPLSELKVGDSLYVLTPVPDRFVKSDYHNTDKSDAKCDGCGVWSNHTAIYLKNGLRYDNRACNLVRLCNNCWRIEKTRVKLLKQKHGRYFAVTEKIKAIEEVGEQEVYNIEMNAPYHNYVVRGGIVTSNSHSIAYGEVGVWTAFVKSHFPLHFFTSALSMADEKLKPKEEIKELVYEAKAMGIEVVGPSLFDKNEDFSICKSKIVFGLSKIRAVGTAKVRKLLEELKGVEAKLGKIINDFTWLEILYFLIPQIGKGLAINLISSGALSKFGISRKSMLFDVNKLSILTDREIEWIQTNCPTLKPKESVAKLLEGKVQCKVTKSNPAGIKNFITEARQPVLKSVLSILKNPPENLTDSIEYISSLEEELLGVPLSCSKLDSCDSSNATLTCKAFSEGEGEKNIVLGVQIDNVREWQPPDKESTLAFVRIHDDSGSAIDMMIPSEAYEKYGFLIFKGNTILVQGMRNKKGGVTAQKISQL